MTIDPHAYNISIRRGDFEGDTLFEARVKELPDLHAYGDTYAEAYDLAVDAIETAAAAYADQGRRFPKALVPVDDYSGRVTLRLPRSLHRALAETAEDEGVSLNQHLVSALSYHSGYAAARKMEIDTSWQYVPKQPNAESESNPKLRLVSSNSYAYQDASESLKHYG